VEVNIPWSYISTPIRRRSLERETEGIIVEEEMKAKAVRGRTYCEGGEDRNFVKQLPCVTLSFF
jgi:hypothetical protein